MLFQTLQSLVPPGSFVKFEVRTNGDQTLTVIASPQGCSGAMSQPFAVTSSAAELDAGFVEGLLQYQKARLSLQEQVDATTAVLAAAQKSEEKKAVKALTSKPAPAVKEKITAKSSDNDDDGDDLEDHDEASENTSTSGTAPSAPAGNLSNLFD